MKILTIDTSTEFATIAVAVDEQIVAESLLDTNRTLSARLVPEINRVLETAGLSISDIDIFASSTGPGSFTGVRGGVATIQGLALATAKPCAGFSSLALLAMNFSLSSEHLICPMLDARKGEVYTALYDCSSQIPISCINDSVSSPVNFLKQITQFTQKPVIFLGNGATLYKSQINELLQEQAVFAPFTLNIPHASNSILLTLQSVQEHKTFEPSALLPVYLRASDAEINQKNNKIKN